MSTPNNNGKTYKQNKPEDARVVAFKRAYMNSRSHTFCNVRQSALKAGYSKDYAENLSARVRPPKWWTAFKEDAEVLRAEMLQKAERNLNNTLDEEPENDTQRKMKTDVSKFVSERVGKEHYSTRSELTGAEGRKLFTNNTQSNTDIALDKLFAGVSPQATDPTTD